MRLQKDVDYAARYTAAIGKAEHRNWRSKYRRYQSIQRQLQHSATRIAQAAPRDRQHPLTAFYLAALLTATPPPTQRPPCRACDFPQQIPKAPALSTADGQLLAPITNNSSPAEAIRAVRAINTDTSLTARADSASAQRPFSAGSQLSDDQMRNILRDTRNNQNRIGPDHPHVPPPFWPAPLPPQPPPITVRSTTAASRKKADETLAPKNDGPDGLLETENQYVIQFLNQHNNSTDLDNTSTLLTLIESVIEFLERDDQSYGLLARQLQKSTDYYGGNPEEVLSLATQKGIICDWLCRNLLGDRLDAIVEKEILKTQRSSHWINADLNQFISQKILPSAFKSSHFKPWILINVMMKELPSIRYFLLVQRPEDPALERFNTINLHDFEWGQIHAGLLLAQSAGLDLDLSIAEAADLGKMLLAQLQEGSVPSQWWQFYRLPALIRYAQEYPELLRGTEGSIRAKMEAHAILDYARSHADFLNKHCAITAFQRLLQNYQTRPLLAAKKIAEKCPWIPLDAYLNRTPIWCIKHTPNDIFSRLDKLGTPDNKNIKSIMPDINQLYQTQIDDIAQAYEVLDKLLLFPAWSKLAEADIDFIATAKIDRAQAKFSAAHILNKVPFMGSNKYAREGMTVLIDSIELFIAESDNEPARTYALKKNAQSYEVQRVDKDEQLYYAFLGEDKRPIDDPSFQLQVHPVGATLKLQKQELEQVFDGMAKKHRDDFSQQLYAYGYEETSLEKFHAFMLSLVPFYTCISAVQDGAIVQAELSCGVDLMILAPVMGELLVVSEKLAQSVVRGSLIAARSATTEMALSHSLKNAIKSGSTTLVQHALLPASQQILKKEELTLLSLSIMRALDPGIELSCLIGRASLEQLVQLGQCLTHSLPRLKTILPQLQARLKEIPPPLRAEEYRRAHFPGIEHEIEVIKLRDDQFNGANVYVRVHPETGELFGRKYTLSAQGLLTPIPRRQSHRLGNLLTQGLGGKGAPEQGLKWAKESETAGSSSAAAAIDETKKMIPPDPDVQATVRNDFSILEVEDDRFGSYFKYNIDLDVFVPQESSHASNLCIIDPRTKQLLALTANAAASRAQTISLDRRTAVIKALGIDLNLTSLSATGPPSDMVRAAIPKTLSFIWVGPKPIPGEILETVRENTKKAHAQGYTVIFYLSTQSKEENLNKLKDVTTLRTRWYSRKKMQIALLEETDFYQGFKTSDAFQQYQDAIHGNHGIATNYASAADILRFALLKEKGGIYLDVDDHLTREFGTIPLLAGPNEFVLGAPPHSTNPEHASSIRHQHVWHTSRKYGD